MERLSARRRTVVVCVDDPGRGRARRTHCGRWGIRCCATGPAARDDLAGALLSWEQHGTSAVAEAAVGGEEQARGPCGWWCPAGTWRSTRWPRCSRRPRRARTPRWCWRRWPISRGVRRRFELVGAAGGVKVFDDYAHHPTKVSAAPSALRTLADESAGPRHRRVPAASVLRAHRLSPREFGAALSGADEVFVLDVYAAREQPIAGVSGRQHRRACRACRCTTSRISRRSPTEGRRGGRRSTWWCTMGAGDVTLLGREILQRPECAGRPAARGDRRGRDDRPGRRAGGARNARLDAAAEARRRGGRRNRRHGSRRRRGRRSGPRAGLRGAASRGPGRERGGTPGRAGRAPWPSSRAAGKPSAASSGGPRNSRHRHTRGVIRGPRRF